MQALVLSSETTARFQTQTGEKSALVSKLTFEGFIIVVYYQADY